MKRIFLLGILLAASLSAMASTDWQLHRFEEGRFAVQLPQAPTKSRQNLRAQPATSNNVFALKVDDGSFMVSYLDSDTFDDDRNRIEAILDNACRGAANNAGATTVRTEPVIRNGFVGRSIRFRGKDGAHFRGLVFLAGTRLYQVYAHGSSEWVGGRDVERFLNSFQMWR